SADLGHEEDLVALPLQAAAEPVFGAAVPIFPAVFEKVDAGVDGLVNEPNGVVHGLQVAKVMAAEPQRRYFGASATQRPFRDRADAIVLVRHVNLPFPDKNRVRELPRKDPVLAFLS